MRWVVVFALVFVGCVATLPADDGLTADLACETAREVVKLRQGMPPSPKPESDQCENCDGTGKLGDGRIVTVCPICKGTGKQPKSVVTHAPVVVDQNCQGGRCK
jgi:hypothetical protein